MFVDGGIIGGPPKGDARGPTFYVSGPFGGSIDTLARHGLVMRALDGGIGAASALKMSYAGITKGIVALGACMILAAERSGVAAALREELAASQSEVLCAALQGDSRHAAESPSLGSGDAGDRGFHRRRSAGKPDL